MTNIVALERPSTDEALRTGLLDLLDRSRETVLAGETSGAVIVLIRPDGFFQLEKAGSPSRLMTVGYLMQAVHDLLKAE